MNNELRNKVKYLIDTYGSSKVFIGKKCGLSRSTISLWLNNERELSHEALIRMNTWLNSLNLK